MEIQTNEPNNPAPLRQRFMNHKLSSMAIVLAVLALATGIAFWQKAPVVPPTLTIPLTQQSEKMAGWKTYTNIEHGFEVQYPDYFKVTEPRDNYLLTAETGADNFSISIVGLSYKNPPAGVSCVFDPTVKVWKNNSSFNTTNEGCPEKLAIVALPVPNVYLTGIGDMFLTGQSAMILYGTDNFIELTVTQNGFDSCAEIGECPDYKPKTDKETIKQILSTFKFTK